MILLFQRKLDEIEEEQSKKRQKEEFVPVSNYQTKYQHLIGLEAAKEAAKKTETNKQYGFGKYFWRFSEPNVIYSDIFANFLMLKMFAVPSENKKDSRSIEQTLADIQNKKKMKKADMNKSKETD